jgi:rhodanese-related sulfurtransferase
MENFENSISLQEFLNLLNNNSEMITLDVRSKEEYELAHILNAVHLPLDEILKTINNFDKSKLYITVCGKGGGRSADAAKVLLNHGFNARWLMGGTQAWLEYFKHT